MCFRIDDNSHKFQAVTHESLCLDKPESKDVRFHRVLNHRLSYWHGLHTLDEAWIGGVDAGVPISERSCTRK